MKIIRLWFLMALILVLTACGAAPSKPEPSSINHPSSVNTGGAAVPGLASGSAVASAPVAAAKKNYARVQVFYVADKNGNGNTPASRFYGSERSDISYGKCMVSIPNDHQPGELESASIFKLEFHEDPNKQIVILNVTKKDEKAYFAEIAKKVGHSKHKSALIYISSYSLSIEDAARRSAQMAYDLKFDGVPVLYGRPSQANKTGSITDENTINSTQNRMETFLNGFASKTAAKNIYLIAHDMDSRSLINTLDSLTGKNPKYKNRFKIIILAAPDIDADIFKDQIAPALKIAAAQQLTSKVRRKKIQGGLAK